MHRLDSNENDAVSAGSSGSQTTAPECKISLGPFVVYPYSINEDDTVAPGTSVHTKTQHLELVLCLEGRTTNFIFAVNDDLPSAIEHCMSSCGIAARYFETIYSLSLHAFDGARRRKSTIHMPDGCIHEVQSLMRLLDPQTLWPGLGRTSETPRTTEDAVFAQLDGSYAIRTLSSVQLTEDTTLSPWSQASSCLGSGDDRNIMLPLLRAVLPDIANCIPQHLMRRIAVIGLRSAAQTLHVSSSFCRCHAADHLQHEDVCALLQQHLIVMAPANGRPIAEVLQQRTKLIFALIQSVLAPFDTQLLDDCFEMRLGGIATRAARCIIDSVATYDTELSDFVGEGGMAILARVLEAERVPIDKVDSEHQALAAPVDSGGPQTVACLDSAADSYSPRSNVIGFEDLASGKSEAPRDQPTQRSQSGGRQSKRSQALKTVDYRLGHHPQDEYLNCFGFTTDGLSRRKRLKTDKGQSGKK